MSNASKARLWAIAGAAAISGYSEQAVSAPAGGRLVTPADTPGLAMSKLPFGYRPLLKSSGINGWHPSGTSHHGTTPDARNHHGTLALGQRPYFQGGILLSDQRYLDFDLYAEFLPCMPCDSGIFFRSTEGGTAYQVALDDVEPTARGGGLIGEGRSIAVVPTLNKPSLIRQDQWNAIRIRVTGGAQPHVTVWMNGDRTFDGQAEAAGMWTDTEGGAIGLQSHFMGWYTGGRWVPGGRFKFRNIGLAQLP